MLKEPYENGGSGKIADAKNSWTVNAIKLKEMVSTLNKIS